MKELTRVINAQITVIEKIENETAANWRVEAEKIKEALNADDVIITGVRDFVMEDKNA